MSSCIIYTRLSKPSNSIFPDNKNLSLSTQLQICEEYAKKNKLNIKKKYTDIKSARKIHLLPQLNQLLKENSDIVLLINTVDRLSRNTEEGCRFINEANKKNIKIVFVSENLHTYDFDTKHIIRMKLSAAEKESDTISRRIKQTNATKRKRGEFLGNRAKYGYYIENINGKKYLKKNNFQQKVINFIVQIKTGKISSNIASQLMYRICDENNINVPIHFYDHKDNIITNFTNINPLNSQEIANLLNDYNVPYINNMKWNKKSVYRIFNDNKKTNINNTYSLRSKMAKLTL